MCQADLIRSSDTNGELVRTPYSGSQHEAEHYYEVPAQFVDKDIKIQWTYVKKKS